MQILETLRVHNISTSTLIRNVTYGGMFFIVMELVERRDGRHELYNFLTTDDDDLSHHDCLEYLQEIVTSMAAVHRLNIVHNDLKGKLPLKF